MEIPRYQDPIMQELGFDSMGSRRPFPQDTIDNITQPQSVFPDLSIPDEKIENLSASKIRTTVFTVADAGDPAETFGSYGSMELFAPVRVYTYDYAGLRTGGPQDAPGAPYDREGTIYARTNFGSLLEDNLMVYIGGAWRTVTTS